MFERSRNAPALEGNICRHDNGNKNYEGTYAANGQKDGVWTWYDETGKQTTVQTYKEGEQIK